MPTGRRVLAVSTCCAVVAALWGFSQSRSEARVSRAPRENAAPALAVQGAPPSVKAQSLPATVPLTVPKAAANIGAPEEAREFPPPSTPGPRPEGIAELPDTPAGRALGGYMLAMFGVGPDAEATYQRRLSELKKLPKEAAQLASDVYRNTPKHLYDVRQSAAETLTALKSHESTAPLSEIANEKMPPSNADDHEGQQRLSEGSIRFTAIRGLGDLAQKGDQAAATTLQQLVEKGDPAVRLFAAQTYAESQGYSREARRVVAANIAPADRLLIEARPTRASEVPQLEPQTNKPINPAKLGAKAEAPAPNPTPEKP